VDDAIKLAVVDDHPAIGLAIEAAATSDRGGRTIRVVGSARRVADALPLLERQTERPDVVLCDIQLETGLDGLEVVQAAHEAGAKAIVLTSFDRS
jgi:DNA-binding NarL/FixJ family response regulator